MDRNYNVNLSFTADTQKAKVQLADLQKSLNQLMNTDMTKAAKDYNFKLDTKDIQEAQKAVAQLSLSLKKATNVDTGKLNLTQFSNELEKSGMDLQQYRVKLSNLGPEGERAFVNLAKSVMTADTALKNSHKMLDSFWITLKNVAKYQISTAVWRGLTSSLSSAFSYAQELNRSLNDIRIVTGKSTEDMAQFAVQANKAAKELSSTTTAYTDAALIYYQQGLDDEAVKARTDITIKAANAAGTSTEEMSDYLTAVWNSYKVGNDELERYVDVMANLGAGTATSLEEIATSMEKVASVGEATGVTFEQMGSIIATVSSVTRQSAETVGTAFKTIFARMADLKLEGSIDEDGVTTTLGTVSKQLNQVGINILDAEGNLRDMGDVIEELMGKWGSMNDATRQAVAIAIAGKRQYTQLLALMNNQDMYQNAMDLATDAEGTLEEQAATFGESWEAAQRHVKAAWQGIYDSLVNDDFFIGMNEHIADFLGFLEKVIDSLGGFKGVLSAVGLLVLQIFDKQINQSLQQTIQSLYSVTSAGKKQAEMLRQEAASQIEALFQSRSSDNNMTNFEKDSLSIQEKRYELQKRFADAAQGMSEDERALMQQALDTNEAYADRAIELAKIKQDMQDLYMEAKESAEEDIANAFLPVAEQKYNALWNKGLDAYQQGKVLGGEELASNFQVPTGNVNEEQLYNSLEGLKSSLSKDTIPLLDFFQEKILGVMEAQEKGQITTGEYQEALNKLAGQIRTAGTSAETAEEFFNYLGKTCKISSEDMKVLKDVISKLPSAEEQAKTAMDNFIKSCNNFLNTARSAPTALETFSKGLTGMLKGISSFSMGISSLMGAWDTLNNADMTFFEKFVSISMSVSMGIPSLLSSFRMFSESWSQINSGFKAAAMVEAEYAITKQIRNKATDQDTASTAANTAATEANTAANVENAAATTAEALETERSNQIRQQAAAVDAMSLREKILYTMAQKNGIELEKEGSIVTSATIKEKQKDIYATLAQKAANGELSVSQTLLAAATALVNGQFKEFSLLIKGIGGKLLVGVAVIAAVSAAIAGLVAVFKAVQENSPEAKLEKLEKESEQASTAFDEASKAVEDLNNKLDSLKEAEDTLSKMTTGTEEWRAKVEETNKQVLELIDTYQTLKDHPEYIQVGANGELTVSEEGQERLKQEAQGAADVAYTISTSKQIDTNQQRLEIETGKLKQELFAFDEDFINTLINAFRENGSSIFARNNLETLLNTNFDVSKELINSYAELIIENRDLITNVANLTATNEKLIDSADKQLENAVANKLGGVSLTPEDIARLVPNADVTTYDEARQQAREQAKNKFGHWNYSQNFDTEDSRYNDIERVVRTYGENATYEKQSWGNMTISPGEGQDEIKVSKDEFLDRLAELNASEIYEQTLQEAINASIAEILPNAFLDGISQQTKSSLASLSQTITNAIDEFNLGQSKEEIFKSFTDSFGGLEETISATKNIDFNDEQVQESLQKDIALFEQGQLSAAKFEEILRNMNVEGGFARIQDQIAETAEALGVEEDVLANYTKYIMESADESDVFADELENNADAALDTASSMMRMDKGVQALCDDFEDWSEILATNTKNSSKYQNAIAEITEALADTLDVDSSVLDADFITDNLDLIQQASEGSGEAIDALRDKLADDILLKVTADLDPVDANIVMEMYNNMQSIADELGPIEIGEVINDEAFLAAANTMVENSHMTADQVNAALAQIGYEPLYSTEDIENGNTMEVPNFKTTLTADDTNFFDVPIELSLGDRDPISIGAFKIPQLNITSSTEPLEAQQVPADMKLTAFSGGTQPPQIKALRKTSSGSTVSKPNKKGSSGGGGGSKGKSSSPKSSSPKSSSSSGGGSAKKARKPQKTDVKDLDEAVTRYKNTDNLLESIDRKLNKIQSKKEQVWGKKYLEAIDEENKVLEEEIAILDQQIKEAESYRNMDLSFLSDKGINVELDENGFVTNFEQIEAKLNEMERQAASIYDNAVNSAPEDDDTIADAAKDTYDAEIDNIEKIKNKMNSYEEAVAKYYDDTEKREELLQQERENNYDKLNHKLEILLELTEKEREQMEVLSKTFREGLYGLADFTNQDNATIGNYLLDFQNLKNQLQETNELFEQGGISEAQYAEKMADIASKSADTVSSILDLADAIGERFIEALEDADDIMDESIGKLEHLKNIMSSVENLINLTYGEEDYDRLGEIYGNIADVSQRELEYNQQVYQQRLQTLAAEQAAYDQYAALGKDDKELQVLEDNLKAAQKSVEEWQERMYESAEEFAEAIINVYQNKVNKAMKKLEDDLTNGQGFDELQQQLERLQTYDEEYLTKENQEYETQKMIRTATNELEKSANQVAKNKLELFIKETQELQKQGRLSEYELGIQQRKYEITLAEIALQEAQANKSQVRLQRDTEGNFNYVYTADEDAVAEAQQKYEDAQNDLYNYVREQEAEIQQKRLQNWMDYYEAAREINEDATLTDVERAEKLTELYEYHSQRDLDLTEQSNAGRLASHQGYLDSYTITVQDDIATTDEMRDAHVEMADTVDDATHELQGNMKNYTDLMSSDYMKVKDSADKYAAAIEKDMSKTNSALGTVQQQTAAWASSMVGILGTVIDSYNQVSNACQMAMNTISGFFSDVDYSLMWSGATDWATAWQAAQTREYVTTNDIGGRGVWDSNSEGGLDRYDYWDMANIIQTSNDEAEILRAAILRQAKIYSSGNLYQDDTNQLLLDRFGADSEIYKRIVAALRSQGVFGFDTGGYTGEFGPEGRFALLHEKELVLNKQDTKNLLDTVNIVDQLLDNMDMLQNFSSSGFDNLFTAKETLEQNVHITAEFPSVQDHNEIELALRNLTNTAAQYANRKRL